MGRLGDLLRTERLRRKLTLKQVAKLGGVSEGYIKDVEEGRRVIGDDQARRILKKMGLQEHNEQGFTLDDIASTVDLETIQPNPSVKRETKPSNNEADSVFSTDSDSISGSVWLDALSSVLKRIPVYNIVMKEIDHKLLPIQNGKIEGASPDKVFYLTVPDDSMRGFRIFRDDLCFILPSNSPIDDSIMLVEYNHHRTIRKIKKIDSMQILLQSYDREYTAETSTLTDVTFIGRVARVEFSL